MYSHNFAQRTSAGVAYEVLGPRYSVMVFFLQLYENLSNLVYYRQ